MNITCAICEDVVYRTSCGLCFFCEPNNDPTWLEVSGALWSACQRDARYLAAAQSAYRLGGREAVAQLRDQLYREVMWELVKALHAHEQAQQAERAQRDNDLGA